MTIRFRHGATSKPVREVDLELGEAMIDEILSGATAPNPIDRGPSDSECKYCDFSSACHKDVCGVNARRFASVTPEEFWQALERRLEHG